EVRSLFRYPGVGIAIATADRQTIKVYGKKQWDRAEKIDAETAFPIYSVTKVFLGVAVARMADAGLLTFDDKVTKWIPEFSVADQTVVQNATIRDLLAHSIGVESADFWLENVPNVTLDEVIERISQQLQAEPYGEFYYSGIETMLLAKVMETASGMPWSDAVAVWVLRPLGLENTYMQAGEFAKPAAIVPTGDGWGKANTSVGLDALLPQKNITPPQGAWPEAAEPIVRDKRELGINTIPFSTSPIDPAQSAYSSASDMAVLAQMLLSKGMYDGEVFLSSEAFNDMITPVVSFEERPEDGAPKTVRWETGSAGPFVLYDVYGEKCFGHTGGSLGAEADFLICPEIELGIYVGITGSLYIGNGGAHILDHIVNHHMGRDSNVVSEAESYLRQSIQIADDAYKAFESRVADIRSSGEPIADLKDFVGRYESKFAGHLDIIEEQNGKLLATLGEGAVWEMEPLAGDQFIATWVGPRRAKIIPEFTRSADGTVSSIAITSYQGTVPVILQKVR
ncbi:MAG: serine hydrolase domain-containing protein, partial [Pseudomonadota bacterium]